MNRKILAKVKKDLRKLFVAWRTCSTCGHWNVAMGRCNLFSGECVNSKKHPKWEERK